MTKCLSALVFLIVVGFCNMGVAQTMEAVIVTQGKSNWRIVNVSDNEVCKFAAAELQRYLKEISGCELPLGAGNGPSIVLGIRKDLASDYESLLPDSSSGFDGYAIAIIPDKIVIGGDNERGVVYGVYDLLERIGCRWFYPQQDPKDVEVIPRISTVSVEIGKTAIASPIEYRICNASSFFFEIDPSAMKAQLDVAMKARYNGMGWQCDHRTPVGEQYKQMEKSGVIAEIKKRGMVLHGPAHSYPHFLPNDLFDEHPEWFGMRDGKR
ncbi:MAG: alpha-glucuronidase family glycosyl hydrolase, partial [Armatimonadota bacterium]|nr:alpha-glucuronidase family glycosyl hydrolase [Armatimonadota bacterium]